MKRTIRRFIAIVVIFCIARFAYQVVINTDWKEPMLLEEAKQIIVRASLEGIPFDIPLLYMHYAYNQKSKRWPRFKDSDRDEVDVIKATALLPNMEKYSARNSKEFNILTHGNKVQMYITHYHVNWPYYFKNFYKRLIHLPESPLVVGMYHYRDPLADNREIYMSHKQPVPELTRIVCVDTTLDPSPPVSPSCRVTTLYRDQFQLNYYYSKNHLAQWREIDKKVRLLLDSFILAGMKTFK